MIEIEPSFVHLLSATLPQSSGEKNFHIISSFHPPFSCQSYDLTTPLSLKN